jgi:putative oxidoreductase
MFVMSGLNKMNNYSNTAGWMDAMGVPGNLLPLVIVLEVLGGAAIMIGWQTRIAAILFAALVLCLQPYFMLISQIKTK